ncbi:MAG: pyridoxamine 5'-phosphate oxidase family protein [Actinobacteria bacterium]|nr:pyridoxamine 5'-phosphate oxidase family protein [Actinomycetota bacterium]
MSNDAPATRPLADVLDDVRIAMVMTSVDGVWSSRPLTCLEVDHLFLRFLVDATTDWVADLSRAEGTVHVTFSDPKANTFVSLNGVSFVSADPAEVERLWTAPAAAFFTGPEDPNIRVLQVEVTDGQWWDGPSGRIGQTVGLLRAAINDDPSMAGDHGIVEV